MSDTTFRVERVETPTLDNTPKSTTPDVSYAIKKETEVDREYAGNLEVWETESNKKYLNEIFDIHNISHEFPVKMTTSQIDKFIKDELAERKYERTTDNYRAILDEIEAEIGSNRLELFERLKKITGYIKTLKRLREVKKKLGAYKPDVRIP